MSVHTSHFWLSHYFEATTTSETRNCFREFTQFCTFSCCDFLQHSDHFRKVRSNWLRIIFFSASVCGAIEWNTVTFVLFHSFYPFFAAHLWFVIVVVCFIIWCFSVAVWVCSLAMCASVSFTWVFHFWNTFNGAWQKTLHYTYIHWNVNRLTHSL